MSSFFCEVCGKEILDTPDGYITECEHYPLKALAIASEVSRAVANWLNSPPQSSCSTFEKGVK